MKIKRVLLISTPCSISSILNTDIKILINSLLRKNHHICKIYRYLYKIPDNYALILKIYNHVYGIEEFKQNWEKVNFKTVTKN